MPRKPKHKPLDVGRPLIAIDWNIVEKELMAGASGTQIAAGLGVCPDTLYDRCYTENGVNFSQYSAEKKSKGERLIHAAQYNLAVNKGNATMLIWLGKQRLGQKETQEENQSSPEIMKAFGNMMAMFEKGQESSRKIEESNNSAETKS